MKLAALMFLLLGSSNGVVSQDSFPETEEAEEGSGKEMFGFKKQSCLK